MFCLNSIMGFLLACSSLSTSLEMPDNCKIYCGGPLFETVQNAHLFHDSKDFVDMPLVNSPDDTLLAFEHLENKSDLLTIKHFVDDYFLPPGTELTRCHPTDYTAKPKFFDKIKDPKYRKWAFDVHSRWRSLCRKVKDDVNVHPNLYSLLAIPHPFIIPGGRFREIYYWDTYWIIKGLLASEMYTSAKNMILNLGDLIRRFGFVPMGGRIYHLKRSHPPLLAGCVMEYYNATEDIELVKEMLPFLDTEYKFWLKERSLNWTTPLGDTYQLFHYKCNVHSPRAEAFKEDLLTTSHLETYEDKVRIWSDIAAATESGWSFSTRWFADSGFFKNNIRGIRTSQIIPVDLNAFICWNSGILADLFTLVGNDNESAEYAKKHKLMKTAMSKVFWDETDGTWYDLDLETKNMAKVYYASNPTPLFTNCFENIENAADRTADYLKNINAHSGGLPSSMIWSDEQWDSPYGAAPTNHIAIEGLRKSNSQKAQDQAFKMADEWVRTNYLAYVISGGKMFEKYNVEAYISSKGSGGEYDVQEGFGWTNGVILDLLLNYGDRLTHPFPPNKNETEL